MLLARNSVPIIFIGPLCCVGKGLRCTHVLQLHFQCALESDQDVMGNIKVNFGFWGFCSKGLSSQKNHPKS